MSVKPSFGAMSKFDLGKKNEAHAHMDLEKNPSSTHMNFSNNIPPTGGAVNYSIGKAGPDRVNTALEANLKRSPCAMIATDSEIRENVRGNLLSLREDVVALGYRWEHAAEFLAVIDTLIADCENPAIDAVELACLHVKPMSFQQAIQAGDDFRRPL